MKRSIDDVLAEARSAYDRVDAAAAADVVAAGGLLVDIRPVDLRRRDGEIPDAVIVDRNQLEWRLDPASPNHLAVVDETTYERRVVVFCDEGFASTLAAVSLRALGLRRATDLVGGFQAWTAAGGAVRPPGPASGPAPTIADKERSPVVDPATPA